MNLFDFQQVSSRTMPPILEEQDGLIFGLGLCGEAGEVAEILKKVYGHGRPLDREHLSAELGDVLWYVSAIATAFGLNLDAVAAGNIEKLKRRYPDGFKLEPERLLDV
jgi:NTP pyrophosphatase (non-canonical NTP hydrolase)